MCVRELWVEVDYGGDEREEYALREVEEAYQRLDG